MKKKLTLQQQSKSIKIQRITSQESTNLNSLGVLMPLRMITSPYLNKKNSLQSQTLSENKIIESPLSKQLTNKNFLQNNSKEKLKELEDIDFVSQPKFSLSNIVQADKFLNNQKKLIQNQINQENSRAQYDENIKNHAFIQTSINSLDNFKEELTKYQYNRNRNHKDQDNLKGDTFGLKEQKSFDSQQQKMRFDDSLKRDSPNKQDYLFTEPSNAQYQYSLSQQKDFSNQNNYFKNTINQGNSKLLFLNNNDNKKLLKIGSKIKISAQNDLKQLNELKSLTSSNISNNSYSVKTKEKSLIFTKSKQNTVYQKFSIKQQQYNQHKKENQQFSQSCLQTKLQDLIVENSFKYYNDSLLIQNNTNTKNLANQDNQIENSNNERFQIQKENSIDKNIKELSQIQEEQTQLGQKYIKKKIIKKNKQNINKLFQSYHYACQSQNEIQLNKAIQKLLNNETTIKEFLKEKLRYQREKEQLNKMSDFRSLDEQREFKQLMKPFEKQILFDDFVNLCNLSMQSNSPKSNNKIIQQDKESPNIQQKEEQEDQNLNNQQNNQNEDANNIQQMNNEQLMQNIEKTLLQIKKFRQKMEQNEGKQTQDEKQQIENYQKQYHQLTSKIEKRQKQRKEILDQMNNSNFHVLDLFNPNQSQVLSCIQIGFKEVVGQIKIWSKERAQLIKKLWDSYEKQIRHELKKYLDKNQSQSLQIISHIDKCLENLESNSIFMIKQNQDYHILKSQNNELKKQFQKSADLFHTSEEKSIDIQRQKQVIKEEYELWLPNFNQYKSIPNLMDKLESNSRKDIQWGFYDIGNNEDLLMKEEVVQKLSQKERWLKSDLERIIKLSKIITNDKIECEKIEKDLLRLSQKYQRKKMKFKELQIENAKLQKNLEQMFFQLKEFESEHHQFIDLKNKLNRLNNLKKDDKNIQCNIMTLQLNSLNQQSSFQFSEIQSAQQRNQNYNTSLLRSASGKRQSSKKVLDLDELIIKTRQTSLLKSQNQQLNIASPKSGSPTKKLNIQMNKIDSLTQSKIPLQYQEQGIQILEMISSMMSKLVMTPLRSVKDLFEEEILIQQPNLKKASQQAEDFLKTIMEVSNNDSRIKLLKLFMGLGEQNPLTQPVSSGFAEMMQGTQLAFDEIFTGEIQKIQLDIEQALHMIKSQIIIKETNQKLERTKQIVKLAQKGIIQDCKVKFNGQDIHTDSYIQVQQWRLLKEIINKESLRKDKFFDQGFTQLLQESNERVRWNNMKDYVENQLKINLFEYGIDFKDFFLEQIDQSNRGYVTSFELANLMEYKIQINVYLLDFIKEALNSIIELDNLVNAELEKVYLKFYHYYSQGKGLSQQGFKLSIQYLLDGQLQDPQNDQKDIKKLLDLVSKNVEKRKPNNWIELEEFISICRELKLISTLEEFELYNALKLSSIKPVIVTQKLTSTNPSQNLPPRRQSKRVNMFKQIKVDSFYEQRRPSKMNSNVSFSPKERKIKNLQEHNSQASNIFLIDQSKQSSENVKMTPKLLKDNDEILEKQSSSSSQHSEIKIDEENPGTAPIKYEQQLIKRFDQDSFNQSHRLSKSSVSRKTSELQIEDDQNEELIMISSRNQEQLQFLNQIDFKSEERENAKVSLMEKFKNKIPTKDKLPQSNTDEIKQLLSTKQIGNQRLSQITSQSKILPIIKTSSQGVSPISTKQNKSPLLMGKLNLSIQGKQI